MSSIMGIGGSSSYDALASMGTKMKRPDPSAMAEQLFSKLDSKGQGYIQQADLQSALDGLATTGSSSASASDLFSQLDSDQDGRVTKQEFSDSLSKLAQQLEDQFMALRFKAGGDGMPPPPEGADDGGFTKDELISQISATGSADDLRASLLSKIVDNFDAADSDGDGKVSRQEAMSYDQQSSGTMAISANSTTGSASTTSSSDNSYDRVLLQIMRLVQAYGLGEKDSSTSSLSVNA
jgi:Ca2+-binding EF-hand superfamily protein